MEINFNSSVFWYARQVFPWYYLLVLLFVSILLSRRVKSSLKLLAACLIVATILIPPHLLIKEFIVFDTYPYSADVIYLMKHGNIDWIHRLGTTPGYALTFATLSYTSGLDVYTLVKIYPLLMLATTTSMLASIPRNKLFKPLAIILSFAFFVNQPINFHRSTLFLPYMLLALILLKYCLETRHHHRHVYLLVALTFAAASTVYPMTMILVPLLAVATLPLTLWRKSLSNHQSFKTLGMYILIAVLATTMYYTFYSLGGYAINKDFQYILGNIIRDIKHVTIKPPTEIIHQGIYMASGVTPEVWMVSILRVMPLSILTLEVLVCLIVWLVRGERKLLSSYLASTWLSAFTVLGAAAFLLGYKGFLLKFPYEYALLSTITLVLLLESITTHTSAGKVVKNIIFPALFIVLLCTPITSYAALPIIHPQATEIHASKFIINLHDWSHTMPYYNKVAYIEYSAPWSLDILITREDSMSFTQLGYNTLIDRAKLEKAIANYPIIIVTSRFMLRDYYIVHEKTHAEVLSNVVEYLSQTRNLVYNSMGRNINIEIIEYSMIYAS